MKTRSLHWNSWKAVSERRSNIVVLQWARLGDLFHSRPVLKAVLREFHPARLRLCCDARYESVAKLFPEVDDVLPLNIPAVAAMLRNDAMLPESMGEILNAIEQLGKVDCCVNLTNHRTAWLYASLLAGDRVLGYGTESIVAASCNGEGLASRSDHIAAKWLSFVSHEGPITIPRNIQCCRRDANRAMSIVCDAGSDSRSLKNSVIQSLVIAAAETGAAEVTLLGARKGDVVPTASCRVRDLRGMTDLNGLYAELASTDLVIGPDTGALHFAAGLGKPILGIYLDGANPAKTGALSADAEYVIAERVQDIEQSIGSTATDWIARHFEKNAQNPEEHAVTTDCPLSIVIPEFAQTHYTDALLRQLQECTLPPGAEIIIVSSALDSIDAGLAKARAGVLRDVEPNARTFAEACNRGAMLARGKWLLFLNDDCEFSPEAFSRLWAARKPNHIVGPQLHDWDGLLQSAGFVFRGDTVSEISESTDVRDKSDLLDGVSAAVMLIETAVFDRLGGFDQRFRNGYEDVDLCLRAKQRGINFSLADSTFTHFKGSSPERHANDDRNLDLLTSLWPSRQWRAKKRSSSSSPVNCRVLLLSDESPNSAGPLIRWRSPLARIGLKEDVDFTWIQCVENTEAQILSALQSADVVIAFRSISHLPTRDALRQWRQNVNGTLIFDADDILIGRFPDGSPRANARQYFERSVKELMQMADITTAPNAHILIHHGCSDERSLMLPSIPLPEHFASIVDAPQYSENFKVGFAASAAHGIDLGVVTPAIRNLLEADESARFYWWGAHPGEVAYHPQVRRGGSWKSDYLIHLRRLQTVPIDLWIVPLHESHTNEARSPVKAFEFIGAGLPCLFSCVEPYQSYLAEFPDLLVQNNVAAWQIAIEKWRHPVMRRQVLSQVLQARGRLMNSKHEHAAYQNLFARIKRRQHSYSMQPTADMAG